MSRFSRRRQKDQPVPEQVSVPGVRPMEVHVAPDGSAAVGGLPVVPVPGESVQDAVLNYLHRLVLATGHPVAVTIHDERIGYSTPIQVMADGSSAFTGSPVPLPGRTTAGAAPQPQASPTATPEAPRAATPEAPRVGTPEAAPVPTPYGAPAPKPYGAPAPAPYGSPAPAPDAAAPLAAAPAPQRRDKATRALRAVPDPEPAQSSTESAAESASESSVQPSAQSSAQPTVQPGVPAAAQNGAAPAPVPLAPSAQSAAPARAATPAGVTVPSLLAEPVRRINEAVSMGRIESAAAMAEQTIASATQTLGADHGEVLQLRELAAYIAYLAGDAQRSFAQSMEVARVRRRHDDERAFASVQSAAAAWRALRDPAQGLALGHELIALWSDMAAGGGPAAADPAQLDAVRARMARLAERARTQPGGEMPRGNSHVSGG
ncbi:tetratricopeptide repeat protein [Streptomyces sp. NPDC002520]